MGAGHEPEVAALEANLWSMWSCFGRGDGCRLVDEPDVLRFETPVAHVPYNTVLRCTTVNHAVLDDILEAYRSRGVPVVWIVHPQRAGRPRPSAGGPGSGGSGAHHGHGHGAGGPA